MKKNITINMFGQLYAIDEDAYELLKNYLETIRSYFSKEAGGEEIANDIEGRIGELFTELKSGGTEAITIEHVESIIKRIGNPEEMGLAGNSPDIQSVDGSQEGSGPSSGSIPPPLPNQKSIFGKKKYYRDGKDKIVAGVLSGASKYFGGDVLLWRLGFIFLCIIWYNAREWYPFNMFSIVPFIGLPIFIYLLLAFLAPIANTPEEKLKMKGLEVNPQNLADEVSQAAKEREAQNSGVRPHQSTSRGCVSVFFSVLGVLAKVFLGIVCLGLVATFIAVFTAMLALLISPDSYIASNMPAEAREMYHANCFMFWLTGISALVLTFIPGYCALHSLLSSSGKTSAMSMGQRLLWFVLWICSVICLTLGIMSLTKTGHECFVKAHTHDGVFFENNSDWKYFKRNNYNFVGEIPSDDDMNDRWTSSHTFTCRSSYYDGSDKTCLYGEDEWGLDYWQVEREEQYLEPGTYRLMTIGRTDNRGCYAYVMSDSVKIVKEIPVYQISSEDVDDIETYEDSLYNEDGELDERSPKVSRHKEDTVSRPDSLGLGWSKVVIEGIKVNDGTLKYGVSTIPKFTGRESECTKIEVGEFRLEKMK